MKSKLAIGALLVAAPLLAIGGGLPYTFQPGQVISAAEINSNFAYLNSRIGGSTGGGLLIKNGVFAGYGKELVLTNGSAAPIEIVEAIGTYGKPLWFVQCSGGPEMRFYAAAPRFLGPGCSLSAQQESTQTQTVQAYQVTYRQ